MLPNPGWVIELGSSLPQAPLYVTPTPTGMAWLPNKDNALRFSRISDAESFAKIYLSEKNVRYSDISTPNGHSNGRQAA